MFFMKLRFVMHKRSKIFEVDRKETAEYNEKNRKRRKTMDVQKFQEKLTELCRAAEENGKVVNGAQVRDFFTGMDLDKNQLLKILRYLKVQGITIEGLELSDEEKKEDEAPKRASVPLTEEEQAYLREYKAGLAEAAGSSRKAEELFALMEEGRVDVIAELAGLYLPVAADIAVEMNCEEILLEDLVQEANLSLWDALGRPSDERKNDAWLRNSIRAGLETVIGEQTEQKMRDDSLVAKVEKLDNAIRELTEDEEDGELKFSVGELAVILDMDAEEIRDVLRLTGDDK